jgi:hypothetical protein
MDATILGWLMIIAHLIWKQPVIPAQAGISVPLRTHRRSREIPAFAGMTTKGRQAGKRDGLGSAAGWTTVFFIRICGRDRCRAHPAGTAFRSHLRRTFRTFRAGLQDRGSLRISGGMGMRLRTWFLPTSATPLIVGATAPFGPDSPVPLWLSP